MGSGVGLYPLDDGRGAIFERPLPGHDGWQVALVLLRSEDHVVLSELRVFPSDASVPVTGEYVGEWSRTPEALAAVGPGGVTATMLRSVSVPELLGEAHRWIRQEAERADAASRAGRKHRRQWAQELAAEVGRPARAGRSDLYYAIWAARYVEKIESGARNPIGALADEHGLNRGQVRDLIHKARERRLLAAGVRGRAAGTLTERGRQALAREGS